MPENHCGHLQHMVQPQRFVQHSRCVTILRLASSNPTLFLKAPNSGQLWLPKKEYGDLLRLQAWQDRLSIWMPTMSAGPPAGRKKTRVGYALGSSKSGAPGGTSEEVSGVVLQTEGGCWPSC